MTLNYGGIQKMRLTIDVTHHDGSTTQIKTADLDGSRLIQGQGLPPGYKSIHNFEFGMVDPLADEAYWSQALDINEGFRYPREEFFGLEIQLPPVDPRKTVFTVEHKEKPTNRVVLHISAIGAGVSKWTEEEAAARAANDPKQHYMIVEVD